MDPVSLIVEALATGGAGAVSASANDVVTSVYGRLKAAVTKVLLGDQAGVTMLALHAANPTEHETPLREAIVESGADRDELILALSRQLLMAADPAGDQVGKYNVQIRGGQGAVVGDNPNVTQTFGQTT